MGLGLSSDDLSAPFHNGRGRACRFSVSRFVWAAAGIVFLATLWVYLQTLQPAIGTNGDSAKFQLVAPTLSIPHTTGYPLYTWLTKLATLLPVRDIAYRVTLVSALAAAAATLALYSLVWYLTRRPGVAIVAAFLLAWSPTFWSQAVIAEVYTLNAALLMLCVFLLFVWRERRVAGWYWAAIGVYALSLGNHASMILWLPALLVFIWITDQDKLLRPRAFLGNLAMAGLAACQYGWLYLRARQHPPFCEYCPDTLGKLWWYVRGAQFKGRFFAFPMDEYVRRLIAYGSLALNEYGLWVCLLAVAGLCVAILRKRWDILALLGVGGVTNVVFAMGYDIVDYAVYLIPSYTVIAAFAALSLAEIDAWIVRRTPARREVLLRGLVWGGVFAGLTFFPLVQQYAIIDQHNARFAGEDARVLLSMLPLDSLLVDPPCCDFYARAMATLYVQQVEGFRPDVIRFRFVGTDDGLAYRLNYLPMTPESIVILGSEDAAPAYFPQVGRSTKDVLERHFLLRPLDSSARRLEDVLAAIPEGSIVALGTYLPASWSVDVQGSAVIRELFRDFGFEDVPLTGQGAQGLVGVKGAAPGTALALFGERGVQLQLRKGDRIGETGVVSPVSLRIISSFDDLSLIVAGRNLSTHRWGYQLIVLEPDSGTMFMSVNFDTETFLVDNVRVYRVAAVLQDAAVVRLDSRAWYPSQARLDFGDFSVTWFMGEGWADPEFWGTWGVGETSSLKLALPVRTSYAMHITAMPYCPTSDSTQAMHVRWNGYDLGTLTFADCEQQTFRLEIPAAYVTDTLSQLDFAYAYALSPFEASNGTNGDRRRLAVGFSEILFEPR